MSHNLVRNRRISLISYMSVFEMQYFKASEISQHLQVKTKRGLALCLVS